jgi:DNA-binding PadR family transcriptional regulator
LWANVSFGSIYPALARLERMGAVEATSTSDVRVGSMSTGSLSGERAALRSFRATPSLGRKGRKVYRITAVGRTEFERLLADPATLDDSRSFSLRMALARYLTPSLRVAFLEQRRVALVQRAQEVRSQAANEQLDEFARSVMLHGAESVELEIRWVDSLLTTEQTNNSSRIRETN